jgi:hypothetical protein
MELFEIRYGWGTFGFNTRGGDRTGMRRSVRVHRTNWGAALLSEGTETSHDRADSLDG